MSLLNLDQALSHYQDLLGDGAATWRQLAPALQAGRLAFGTRPICNVLRPLFIPQMEYAWVQATARNLAGALSVAGEILLHDPAQREMLGLSADEEKLIALDPGFAPPDASGRLDAFWAREQNQLSFIEYNAESPGGLAYGEGLGEVFSQLPVMQTFGRTYPFHFLPIRPRILDVLLHNYRLWGGQNKPRIAIVDFHTARTYNEFILCQEYFNAQGFPTRILDPEELEYREGRLQAAGEAIDLVYKRILTVEMLARYGTQHPLVQAVADHAVCMVNSFRALLLHNKAIFALLSDERNSHYFSPDQRQTIENHLPWTRRVSERTTDFHGRRVDLLPFLAEQRELFALKPAGAYGGQGVTLGWETDSVTWEATLQRALAEPWIVQVRVPVPQEVFPTWIKADETGKGQLEYSPRLVDIDPYVWNGLETAGAGVRVASTALLNVSAGGGSAVPLCILADG